MEALAQHVCLLLLLVSAACAGTPTEPGDFALGAEVQVYPAGVIYGAHGQIALDEHSVLTLRAAANDTDREDYGEQDDEEGDGTGGGIGYRRYYGDGHTGWLWGVRVDVWDLEIDWEDDAGPKGTTDVIVLQPTAEFGYGWRLGDSPWRLDATLAAGAEINVDEDGEDVGDGAILLGGLTLTFGF